MPSSLKGSYVPRGDLLAGRRILVTGAGDGIGRVAAITFAEFGADVILLGRTREKLEGVSDAIRNVTQTDPLIVPLDLLALDPESAMELQQALLRENETLDGLLHNASVLGLKSPIATYPSHTWDQVMQVNVRAQFLLTQALLPLLEQSDDAAIVYTSSGVGRIGRAYWGAYAVSKFATEGFMEVLADEVKTTTNIRVNSLNPGGTRTAMRAAAYPAEDPATLPSAEEHMNLYLYLIGPDSKGVTQQKFDTARW